MYVYSQNSIMQRTETFAKLPALQWNGFANKTAMVYCFSYTRLTIQMPSLIHKNCLNAFSIKLKITRRRQHQGKNRGPNVDNLSCHALFIATLMALNSQTLTSQM